MNKRVLAICMVFLLFVVTFNTINDKENEVEAETPATAAIVRENVNLRTGPSTDTNKVTDAAGNGITLPAGLAVTITDRAHDSSGNLWYYITTTYNGSPYTGYVFGTYITLDVSQSVPVDAAFEEYMSSQGFPESYKPYLRELKKMHPNWNFVAKQTGLEWSSVVENEVSRPGRIRNTEGWPGYLNWRATEANYNILTNEWQPYDGASWYAAADDLIAYYLDPRIYLDEVHIFAFESLEYQDGLHTTDGVNAILAGTFMAQGNPVLDGDTRSYAELIMLAAQTHHISPYHIASRIRQEMGVTAGSAADGSFKINEVSYYNYYNIGAYDGSNALLAGMRYAAAVDANNNPISNPTYGRPWNSVEKSITGGAEFLASSYISKGQSTLYTQKFNVTGANLYGHQYCTNVQMPYSESASSYKAYFNIGALDSGIVFSIPVYNNMPENILECPNAYGNPNNYLKELNVGGYTLSPEFSVGFTTDYTLNVGDDVSSLQITATAAQANAWIQGAGTVQLAPGTNVVNLNVTSQSGRVRTYRITINRGAASDDPNYIQPGDNSHKGDLNGDGQITVIDIVKLQRLIVGLDALTDASLSIADLNGDGKVSAIDIVIVQRHIVGLQAIEW